MNAYKFNDSVGLIFTKVLDEMPLGLIGEDEEIQEVTDRDYWLKRATKPTVQMADKMLEIVNSFEQGYELKYNKFYIGIAKNGQPDNFVIFKPKKSYMRLELRHPQSEEFDELIEQGDLDDMGYDTRWNRYRIRLTKDEVTKKKDIIISLIELSHRNNNA